MDGTFLLDLSVLREGVLGVDPCEPGITTVPCPVLEDLPTRTLTPDEATEMLDLFANVTLLGPFFEPCAVGHRNQFDWDVPGGELLTDDPCDATYVESNEALLAFLEGLHPG
jgi:hypothetical protein